MTRPDTMIVRATSAVVTAAAYVAGAVLVILMLLTTADVVGRYFFDTPITGVFDLTHFAVLIMVFFGLAYCGWNGGHVAIELLYDRLGPAAKDILKRVINLIGCFLFVLIAWRTAVQSVDVRDFEESSQLLLIPYWPFYWLVAFGAALFAVVMAIRIFVPEPESTEE